MHTPYNPNYKLQNYSKCCFDIYIIHSELKYGKRIWVLFISNPYKNVENTAGLV